MKLIEKQLKNEKKKLQNELEKIRKRFKGVPNKGSIRAKKNGNRIEYYFRPGKGTRIDETIFDNIQEINANTKKKEYYIKKENIHIVKKIVQGDYDSCVLENIEKRIKVIEQFLSKYKKTNISKIYENTSVYKRAKEEIYLEHCGRMDDPGYVDDLMFKLKSYEKNGIYLGVNLFITYENSRFPFNAKMLDELMAKLFCYTKHDFL